MVKHICIIIAGLISKSKLKKKVNIELVIHRITELVDISLIKPTDISRTRDAPSFDVVGYI